MAYALEGEAEFYRLEKQSLTKAYDFKRELRNLPELNGKQICDMGCGSGIVSRYLATRYPHAKVIGCDSSAIRVKQAIAASTHQLNLRFEHENLTDLSYRENLFDVVIARFVLQHLNQNARNRAVQEFFRCLKPGGRLILIDIDGALFNMHPMPKAVRDGLRLIEESGTIDLHVGRKLPNLVARAGFSKINWQIETQDFKNRSLDTERRLMKARFLHLGRHLTQVLGSDRKSKYFCSTFLDAMKRPGVVFFQNKFVLKAEKLRR
jgi:ubiquinone/menaquinone biosynthesis C-methylase UbiE